MATAKQYQFSVGHLWLTRTDIANPTPRKVGVLQEVSVETKFETKSLRGSQRFPVDTAQGPATVTGKFKFGQICGRVLSDLLGGVASTALKLATVNEAATIGTTPYQVTVSGSAQFYEDLGVIIADTGQQMERVASSPTTGQYSVSAGVYTFAAADTTKPVLISYSTTASSPAAPNTLMTLSNTEMGAAPAFSLNLGASHRGKTLWTKFHAITLSGLTLPLKMDDYMIPEGSFEAFADESGTVMSMATAG